MTAPAETLSVVSTRLPERVSSENHSSLEVAPFVAESALMAGRVSLLKAMDRLVGFNTFLNDLPSDWEMPDDLEPTEPELPEPEVAPEPKPARKSRRSAPEPEPAYVPVDVYENPVENAPATDEQPVVQPEVFEPQIKVERVAVYVPRFNEFGEKEIKMSDGSEAILGKYDRAVLVVKTMDVDLRKGKMDLEASARELKATGKSKFQPRINNIRNNLIPAIDEALKKVPWCMQALDEPAKIPSEIPTHTIKSSEEFDTFYDYYLKSMFSDAYFERQKEWIAAVMAQMMDAHLASDRAKHLEIAVNYLEYSRALERIKLKPVKSRKGKKL